MVDAPAAPSDVLQDLRGQGETPQRQGLPAAAAGVAGVGRKPADSCPYREQAPGSRHKRFGRALLEPVPTRLRLHSRPSPPGAAKRRPQTPGAARVLLGGTLPP